jgi:hypothetical protein
MVVNETAVIVPRPGLTKLRISCCIARMLVKEHISL